MNFAHTICELPRRFLDSKTGPQALRMLFLFFFFGLLLSDFQSTKALSFLN